MDLQLIGVHQPPKGTDNTERAQREAIERLGHAMSPHSKGVRGWLLARLAPGDYNRTAVEAGPGPSSLAVMVQGVVTGFSIDCAVSRRPTVLGIKKSATVAGVHMGSDHNGATRLDFRTGLLRKQWHLWFYNVQIGRGQKQVDAELHALARSQPLAIVLCETVGYDLPELDGYTLVRDRSTEGRANQSMYVRADRLRSHHWLDMTQTWSRTQHAGKHGARSYPVARINLGRVK